MPYIKHSLGKTYYRVEGSKRATGAPLICLHGGPGGHSKRLQALFALASNRRVFIYDQIGGGRSSATAKKHWNIGTFVDELDYLVDAWGLDKFHLFGASWGTTLALEYVLKHKKRVHSLTFQSPMFSAADWEADAKRLIQKLPAPTRKIINYCHEINATDAEVYETAMKLYYSRHVCRNKAQLKHFFAGDNPNGARVYTHMWGPSEFKATGTLRNYSKVHKLKDVNKPTLVICGEHDEAQPATGRRYVNQLPNASFKQIANASHAILAEKPAAMIKVIDRFLLDQDKRLTT